MLTRTAIRRVVASSAAGLLSSLSLTAQSLPAQAAAAPLVAIGPVHGSFYTNPSNLGGFDLAQSSLAFGQDFPVIGFNPPLSQQPCTNLTNVSTDTRPFTDVVPKQDGTCSTVVAQGNGLQAGAGNLFNFEAVFTANLTVAASGPVTFNVIGDDGWVFAAGKSASGSQPKLIAGPLLGNPLPTVGFATGFPVIAAANVPQGPGLAPVTVDFPTAGTYPIEIDYSECCAGSLSLVLGTAQIPGPIPPAAAGHTTALTYTGPTSQDFNDPAALTARLLDTSLTPSVPLPNQTVSFNLGGQTCSGVTDQGGIAACPLTPTQAAGAFSLTATFSPGASSPFLGSSAATTFTVTREETVARYTGPTLIANGRGATLSAILKEDGVVPIAGRTLTITQGTGAGAQSCSGLTDGSGSMSCSLAVVNQSLGPGSISASFAGDSFYLPSTGTASTLVFQFLASGSFVIGDKGATASASVNFWGAQWSQLNPLSGGSAPSSFKGFADTTSNVGCGAGWTSDPGNSSGPPASLPSYMAVLVARTVTQSGSTISGDTQAIVIVQTAPGYMPDPGNPGTGTIVAVLCH